VRGKTNNLTVNLTQTDPLTGKTLTLSGSTSFAVNGTDQITGSGFQATTSDNSAVRLHDFILTRSGNQYSGDVESDDGDPLTSWRDYFKGHWEITDTNDADGNGVPDFSDALPVPPSIASQPQSQTVSLGRAATFTVSATGTAPLSYQWTFNGAKITDATNSTLSLPTVTAAQAGSYAVVVANQVGTVTSAAATLTIQFLRAEFTRIVIVQGGQVQLQIQGPVGHNVTISTSTDLVNWLPWVTLPNAQGTLQLTDPITTSIEKRFYLVTDGNPPPTNPDPTDLVWIWPGTFSMGSPTKEGDRFPQEGPQTVVTLTHGFWMTKYEVTQGQYLMIIGNNPSRFTGDLRRPVEQVSWADATNYCAKITEQERQAGRLPTGYTYRLPTEAEWGFACRAGTTTRFSFGDDIAYSELGEYSWYSVNSAGTTHPVGTKRPNPWGLYDMHGNLPQWCLDRTVNPPPNYIPPLPGGSEINPTGALTGSYHVYRSGGYCDTARNCRSACRFSGLGASSCLGFRVVLASD
jgi:formylglycine-generating enzyme required for sulfatase activity